MTACLVEARVRALPHDETDALFEHAADCPTCTTALLEERAYPFGCAEPRLGHAVLCELDRLLERSDGAADPLRAHVAACPACQAEVADAQLALLGGCGPAPQPPPLRVLPGVSLQCLYCRDGLPRHDAVFCAACLAPHHAECFEEHGRCCAPGCDGRETVRSAGPVRPRRRWTGPLLALLAGAAGAAVVVAALGGSRSTVERDGLPSDAARAARPGKLSVATVDIGVLFRDYARKDELERAVNERRDRIKRELAQAAEAQMSPVALQEMQTRHERELKVEVERCTLTILRELELAIREHRARAGYDLVLKVDRGERAPLGGEGDESTFRDEIFRAQIGDILAFEDALDITPSVLAEVNAPEFIARMKKLAEQR